MAVSGRCAVTVMALCSCVGTIVEPPAQAPPTERPAAGPPGVATPTPEPGQPAPDRAGPHALRRLTSFEYANTVRDLLGVAPALVRPLGGDVRGGHGFIETDAVTEVAADRILESARVLADAAALPPCEAGKTEDACLEGFVRTFGRRAFRRPLSAEEVSTFLAFDRQLNGTQRRPYADRLRSLTRAFLTSPELLYLGGTPADARGMHALDAFERASRLSYLLWASMPDEALLAAAETGKLSTTAQIESQARRMMRDKRATDALLEFFTHWLETAHIDSLEKDSGAFPLFTAGLRDAMKAEHAAFLRAVLVDGDGKLETLLGARFSVLNESLARLYGVTGVVGTAMRRADLPAAERAGVLTQAAFLAVHGAMSHSSPITRGKVLYHNLLCGHVPDPPVDVPPPRPPAPNLTTRERFAEHARAACAVGCHSLIDPLGFALEIYDGIGAHRTKEGNNPIDASGVARFPTEGARPFRDAVELMTFMRTSEDVRRCVASKWLRFALHREELPTEAASVDGILARFAASGHDLRELPVAIAVSTAFLYRGAP